MIRIEAFVNKLKGARNIIRYLKVNTWPSHFLVNFGLLGEKEVIYNFRNGIKFKNIRNAKSDQLGFYYSYIFKNRCYAPSNFSIEENDIVVDVGAYIGVFTIFAAKLAKNGKVYAYEPMIPNFNFLKQNIHLNSLKNVIPFNLGVAGKPGKRKLFLVNNRDGHNLFKPTKTYVEIQCTSLKEIFEIQNLTKIDFLKLNCEGSESEILFNTPKEYLKKIKKISLSYHYKIEETREDKQMNLIKYLQTNNFNILYPTKAICKKFSLIYAKQAI